jgi:hypothetical protein
MKVTKIGGRPGSVTASTALLNQKLFGTLNAPRMLTPSEIALLRQSKREIAERYKSNQKEVG